MIKFKEADIASMEARDLIYELDAELRERYPEQSIYGVDEDAFIDVGGKFFLIVIDEKEIAGCGALRPLDRRTVEIKRMFVRKKHRRRGVSTTFLRHLETTAWGLGFQSIALETGREQPEALNLYGKTGYREIPCFGLYASDPHSICFEKRL